MAPSVQNHTKPHRPTATPTHSQSVLVMLPLPAQGHLNQLLHLSRLFSAANFPVHYLGTTTHVRQARLRVHGWDWDPAAVSNIHFHECETLPLESPPPDPNSAYKFPTQLGPSVTAAMNNLRQPLFSLVSRLSGEFRRVVVVSDALMAEVVQGIDSVPNAEAYSFQSISAFATYSFRWEARGKPELPVGAEVLREGPGSDGCFTPDFVEFASRQQEGGKKIFCGEIYNSNRAIERLFLDLLAKESTIGGDGSRLWALGPFNPVKKIPLNVGNNINNNNNNHDSSKTTRHKCLKWLDRQDPNSVIFVSFGSTTSLSDEQIAQIALGLEKSKHKFLWVVRDADRCDIFNGDGVRKVELPQGYEERIEDDEGMIIRDWAPQLEILGHGSTGGFVSHCGWNSCMESISMGVPMITWPMHSDQPNNAALVTKVLRTGVELKDWSRWKDMVVSADMVEKAVRKLMGSQEGIEIRERAKELGIVVRESHHVKEGGSSCMEMESFLAHITR